MLKDEFPDDADDWGYYHARAKIRNTDLQKKYDEMHKQGVTSWFSDGREERETILKMGEPWDQFQFPFEIGCGEGDLLNELNNKGLVVTGIDYSNEAVSKAKIKYPSLHVYQKSLHECESWGPFDVIIMQGVLEHLDDPLGELKWMMDNLLGEHGDVITSSPCFLNPRGIVWMTLDMLGAVMSKTDLHYLHPWEFLEFADKHGYKITWQSCDSSWGNGSAMIDDLMDRIPKAIRDGKVLTRNPVGLTPFLMWLEKIGWGGANYGFGATMIYKITK